MESEKTDRRGTPPGAGTVVPAQGGRIGNPSHVRDEAKAAEIRTLAKVASQELAAEAVGISVDTLQRYYLADFNAGKREAVMAVGGKLLAKAMNGDRTCMIFYLRTQGKWSTRVELTGVDGGPIRTFDLSRFSPAMKRVLLAEVEELLAQEGAGLGEEDADDGRTLQ
jgi:hypothetical protein